MFFTFVQNNSGGIYHATNDLDETVIIEAETGASAIKKATDIGIYFNGVAAGLDCECCGNRWCEPDDGTKLPKRFGVVVKPTAAPNATIVCHFQDGSVRRMS